ncbi:MAG: Succinylglutamate desuccinylase [Prochlorococcus marinus str. MIT 9215]|nr:MAG: Succinylglutamate desuccinylase [Prochlorococcus marinus str. MIT 9215]
MSGLQLLLVAGTHGNEVNAPWLLDQWLKQSTLINTYGMRVLPVIGNPAARTMAQRYLDRDLNRSFRPDLLQSKGSSDQEVDRAKQLLSLYGPEGSSPCQIAIDLHSTTAAMGSSLVVYGRRPADLALAGLIQARLGLPIYLHEGDQAQQGFLVERWPCGLVIEIGPVPQGLLQARIVEQTRLAVEACFEALAAVSSGLVAYPDCLVIHRHLGSLDLPRQSDGQQAGVVHAQLQGRDWQALQVGTPLFTLADGEVLRFEGESSTVPVFINEAAYAEKHIAMSLTKREVWPLEPKWSGALQALVEG